MRHWVRTGMGEESWLSGAFRHPQPTARQQEPLSDLEPDCHPTSPSLPSASASRNNQSASEPQGNHQRWLRVLPVLCWHRGHISCICHLKSISETCRGSRTAWENLLGAGFSGLTRVSLQAAPLHGAQRQAAFPKVYCPGAQWPLNMKPEEAMGDGGCSLGMAPSR